MSPATARMLPSEGADGVTLVVINCMGSGGGQLKSKNGGMKLGEVFGHAMRAFHAEVAIGPETEVVFLVSEPNWNTLSHLIPEPRSASWVPSPGGEGGAAVVWGSEQLGRAGIDCSPPVPTLTLRPRHSSWYNALLSRVAVAELQLPLPAPSGGASTCLFLCYHGPYKDIGGGRMSVNDKVKWARSLFELAWALATRAGEPIAVGGDFNLSAAGVEAAQYVPSGAIFEEVKYDPSPRKAHKEKIDWLFLLSPRGCTLQLCPCTAVRVLDPAEPHRRVAEVHAKFFDHDAIIVGLALAVRWNVVQAQAAVRIQDAARSSAARQGAKAPAAAARAEAAVWVIDLRFLTAHCCASVGIRRVLTFADGA